MKNPFLDREPDAALRDPAAFFHDGTFHCFYTVVEQNAGNYSLFVDVSTSRDLEIWSSPRRLTPRCLTPRRLTRPGLNFSSPGNIVRWGDEWVLCLQSYPTKPGQAYGSDDSRLWTMKSRDLEYWDEPVVLQSEGCQANWGRGRRQIDPYLVEHDGKWWCFYKNDGKLGLLVSPDLENWREASPDTPVLSPEQTPDGATVENPCVVRDGEQWVLFFAPCREGRGIGVARSTDLLKWHDVRYLDFPRLEWADGGPTAAMVLKTNDERGKWTMWFHGDREAPHGAALGIARSNDLEHWCCAE